MSQENPPTRDEQTLSAYIDGELTVEEARSVEAWLAEDETARGLVDELRSVAAAVQDLEALELSGEWKRSLAQRLDRATIANSPTPIDEVVAVTPRVSVGRSSRGWWWSAGAIAAALLVAFLLPRDPNVEVAKAPVEKPLAVGGEIAASNDKNGEESLERNERIAGGSDLEADAMLAEGPARDSEPRMELRSEADLDAPSAAPALESPAEGGAGFGLADSRAARDRDSFSDFNAPESGEALAPTAETFMVVWCDVPPESLQKQTIDKVLTSNGIEVESRTAAWTAAAESMRNQIANRSLQFSRARGGETRSAAGFGGGGRFSVPESSAEELEEVDRFAGKDDDSGRLPAVVEGETILVEASVEQLAACLHDMDLDTDNYRMITVEPIEQVETVDEAKPAGRPDAKAQNEQPSAEPLFGVGQLKEQQPVDSSRENELADEEESNASGLLPEEEKSEASVLQHAGSARRLARPSEWYYYNTAPQEEGQAYRLRGLPEANAQKKIKLSRGLGELQKQMDNLSRAPKGESATAERFSKVDALRQQQQAPQVQVLFVLRNADLPTAPPPSVDAASAGEEAGDP